MVNLAMAACWLILGVLLLAWRWSDPTGRAMSTWGTGISLGWFAIAMALYNLLRWFLGGFSRKVPESKLELRRRREPDAPVPTHDPRFDFTSDRPGHGET